MSKVHMITSEKPAGLREAIALLAEAFIEKVGENPGHVARALILEAIVQADVCGRLDNIKELFAAEVDLYLSHKQEAERQDKEAN
jgi:hypothetical protein